MAIELKTILEYQGVPDTVKTEEEYKEWYDNTFIKKDTLLEELGKNSLKTGFYKDVIDKSTGKRISALSTKIKTNLTKFGIEIGDDIAKKPLEDVIDVAFETFANAHTGTIAELTEKANKNSGEQTKELQEKYSKLESKFNDTKKSLTDLSAEYTGFKEKAANDLKGVKIQTIREQAMGKIPRRNDIEAKQYGLMLTGFENTIDSKFKIDLDENNQPFIADKKTGERFRDPSKAGEFLGIEDVLKKEAAELGISPKNPFQPPAQRPLPQQNGNGHPPAQTPSQERPRASRKV